MAKEIFLKKNPFGNFEPYSAFDRRLIDDLPANVRLKAKITQTRSVPHSSLYWVILGKVVENQSCFPSADVLHEAIKDRLGYSTDYEFPDGYKFKYRGSVAFNKMDQAEYKIYFDKAMDLICSVIIPGLDLDLLMRESQ